MADLLNRSTILTPLLRVQVQRLGFHILFATDGAGSTSEGYFTWDDPWSLATRYSGLHGHIRKQSSIPGTPVVYLLPYVLVLSLTSAAKLQSPEADKISVLLTKIYTEKERDQKSRWIQLQPQISLAERRRSAGSRVRFPRGHLPFAFNLAIMMNEEFLCPFWVCWVQSL